MNGRVAFGLTVAAAGWSLALVAAALLFPVYSDGSTLVGYNGVWLLGSIGLFMLPVVALLGLATIFTPSAAG
jgi:hypothetical protein